MALTPFDYGRHQQQHRLEKLVKGHLCEIERLSPDYFKTDLEKAMAGVMRQFIDAVRAEAKSLPEFSSIYLPKKD